jgi:restriction endonuclease Mrr
MAIPDYQTLMLPLLKLAEGGQVGTYEVKKVNTDFFEGE